MHNYEIDKNYTVLSKADNNGSQSKFHKDNYWYKYNRMGNEGLAEQMTSDLLSCSNVTDYVVYEYCLINGRNGCRSENFLQDGEQFITLQRLYQNCYGGELIEKINSITDIEERYVYLLNFIEELTGLDASNYLYQNMTLDMIIKNPDRHYNNLGVILQKDGNFRFAPIFDKYIWGGF